MEHGDITTSKQSFEQDVISRRHSEEDCRKGKDGEWNEAGGEEGSYDVRDVDINEVAEINGRRLLQNADVRGEDELRSCLIDGTELYNTEEIEALGGPMREFGQIMFINVMKAFDAKIQPFISVVSKMQKQLTYVKKILQRFNQIKIRTVKLDAVWIEEIENCMWWCIE